MISLIQRNFIFLNDTNTNKIESDFGTYILISTLIRFSIFDQFTSEPPLIFSWIYAFLRSLPELWYKLTLINSEGVKSIILSNTWLINSKQKQAAYAMLSFMVNSWAHKGL